MIRDKSGVMHTKAQGFEILRVLGNIRCFIQANYDHLFVNCTVAFVLSTTIYLLWITFVTYLTLKATRYIDYTFLDMCVLVITLLRNPNISKSKE